METKKKTKLEGDGKMKTEISGQNEAMQKGIKDKTKTRVEKIPEKKTALLKELKELSLKNNTVIISSLKNVPSRQFQKIRKKLKDRVKIKVVKKLIIIRALEEAGKQKTNMNELGRYVEEGCAVLFSQLDPFELAGILSEERSTVKAKAG